MIKIKIEKDKFLEYINKLNKEELENLIYDLYKNHLTYEDVKDYIK